MAKKKRFSLMVDMRVPEMHEVVRSLGVDEKGDVQRLVTDECLARVRGYMPRRTGRLAGPLTAKADGSHITTEGPYARFLFFGVKADGLPVDYSRAASASAGPHWDRRLAQAEGAAIAAKAQAHVDRKRGKHGR